MARVEAAKVNANASMGANASMALMQAHIDELEQRMVFLEKHSPKMKADADRELKAVLRRASAIDGTDPKWGEIRKRWPNLSKHNRALEAFERHVATLGGEPSRKHLLRKAAKFNPNRHYMRPSVEVMGFTRAEAQAYMWFLQQAGLATFVKEKGMRIHAQI